MASSSMVVGQMPNWFTQAHNGRYMMTTGLTKSRPHDRTAGLWCGRSTLITTAES